MEQVRMHNVDVVDVGAIDCTGYNDTVEFGGITMNQFTFGSCNQENDLFYLERYSHHKRSNWQRWNYGNWVP